MYKKLSALRKELPKMRKDQKGYNYKYFDINQMIDVIQPLLEKHNLAIFQPLTHIEGKPAIKTILVDLEDEKTLEFETPLLELADAQKMGGCITYFRRYALQSLLFMEAEDLDMAQPQKNVQPTKAKGYERRKAEPMPKVDNSLDKPF